MVHTNTIENVFSVFKRGMRGTYQHCKEKHLHRYLAEFDFRYNNRIARRRTVSVSSAGTDLGSAMHSSTCFQKLCGNPASGVAFNG